MPKLESAFFEKLTEDKQTDASECGPNYCPPDNACSPTRCNPTLCGPECSPAGNCHPYYDGNEQSPTDDNKSPSP